jgi:hypothetical protein
MLTKDTKVKIVMHWEDEDGVKRPVAELDNIDLETNDKVLAELDYVRVVRCKDCKWFEGTGIAEYGNCFNLEIRSGVNDYCSFAERREANEDDQ